ncbi:hypothetical protein HPB49_012080 [Dermacentor silvarum]|uniref:Uncharacterized protein n=1 Tax=Dermacentor silvarum TaxID=543639 RepID=A0ACB8DZG4_DERSI|nr:hypothetical protein HPB49_012080 [Dermacentor silvarum]
MTGDPYRPQCVLGIRAGGTTETFLDGVSSGCLHDACNEHIVEQQREIHGGIPVQREQRTQVEAHCCSQGTTKYVRGLHDNVAVKLATPPNDWDDNGVEGVVRDETTDLSRPSAASAREGELLARQPGRPTRSATRHRGHDPSRRLCRTLSRGSPNFALPTKAIWYRWARTLVHRRNSTDPLSLVRISALAGTQVHRGTLQSRPGRSGSTGSVRVVPQVEPVHALASLAALAQPFSFRSPELPCTFVTSSRILFFFVASVGFFQVGPCPHLDLLSIFSRRLRRHVDTIRIPVRRQAGPPSPSKHPKRRGAALTLRRRAWTSGMQRLTKPLQPALTDGPPASSSPAASTAMPTLSTLNATSDVNSSRPAALSQPAAFLSSAHDTVKIPATFNALSDAENSGATAASQPAFVAAMSTTTKFHAPAALLAADSTGSTTPPLLANVNSMSTNDTPKFPSPTASQADDSSVEMDFTASPENNHNTPTPESTWSTVGTSRKPASTAQLRTELISVGIQLPPGTLPPKLALYDLLAAIISAAHLSSKTSAEITLQAKPAQSLVFLKTHSPLTAHLLLSLTHLQLNAFRPSAAAVLLLCPRILPLTYAPNPGGRGRWDREIPFLRRTALRRATQATPSSASSSAHHDSPAPPTPSPPGSYAATAKGSSASASLSSATIPSPSLVDESRSFDPRLTMLERHQREQQRISHELQKQIHTLTQTLQTTTSSLTFQLIKLNEHLSTLITSSSNAQVAPLADLVETTTTAHTVAWFN